MTGEPPVIMGFDPGTHAMGYGVLAGGAAPEAKTHGTIKAPKSMSLEARLHHMHKEAVRLISEHGPDCIAVEQPFVGQGGRSFPAASLAIGQAQATIMIAAVDAGIPVHRYPPADIKKAIAGDGNAKKETLRSILSKTLGAGDFSSTDASDAMAAAYCHWARADAVARHPELATAGSRRTARKNPKGIISSAP